MALTVWLDMFQSFDWGDPCDDWSEAGARARCREVYRRRCMTEADVDRCVDALWLVYSCNPVEFA